MSNRTLVNLATVGSDELQAMPITVFNACLEQMSADAIARFRRLRKLNASQRSAVEHFLAKKSGLPATPSRGASERPQQSGEKGKPADGATQGPAQASFWTDLMLRLAAWWEGADTDALARSRGIQRWRRPAKAKTLPAAVPAPAREEAPQAPPPLTRVELLQKLWGDGFSLPGGAAFALRIAKTATLNKNALCLDLSPGLGGGMRVVAQTLGVRIHGIESDTELAEAAAALSSATGMNDEAPVRAAGDDGLGREDFEPVGGHAAIFMREAMFAVEGRERMLAAMHEALEADGSLILTDFVIANDGHADAPAVAHWRAAEPHYAEPWTEAEYRAALEAQHYKVERFDDLTPDYLPLVKEGLRRFHDCLQNVKLPPETLPILMREGNLWLARSQALETGQLSLVHIHARRVSPPADGEHARNEPPAASDDAIESEAERDEHG